MNSDRRPASFVLLLLFWGVAAAPALAESCIKCHVKPAEAVTDRMIFHRDRWKVSVHASVDCTDCHEGADDKAFDVTPHRMGDPPPSCAECHDDDFPDVTKEFKRSVHAARDDAFSCVKCHSPHEMRTGLAKLPRAERVRESNGACIGCHTAAVLDASGKKATKGLTDAHAWDRAWKAHARIRCVVCHTPVARANSHEVLPSEQSIRDCDACHDVNAPLIAEYVGPDDPSSWITNPLVFKEAYLPGATRHRVLDAVARLLFWLTVGGVLVHALLRIVTRRNRPRMSAGAEKVKMYAAWLRVWHWTNAILFIVLAYTGLRLHFGQRPGPVMSFETAFNVHNLAGSVLVVVGVLFFLGNVFGRNQQQYLSRPRDGLRGVLRQARWYLLGIFKGEPHPYHAAPEHKFNPLQHLTYVGVMYVMYPLLILSGIALLFPGFLPSDVFGHPGVWWVAVLHWVLGAVGILFLVVHLYLGSMGDKARDLYAAMIDGYHRHRTREPKEPPEEPQAP